MYQGVTKKNELDFIFLVTPETSAERLVKLDQLSSGFLYAVSSSATTGKDKDFNAVALYLEKLQQSNLKNPILVGFGIKDKSTFEAVAAHANGAIIGTAFIKALQGNNNVTATTQSFLNSVLN